MLHRKSSNTITVAPGFSQPVFCLDTSIRDRKVNASEEHGTDIAIPDDETQHK